MIMNTYFLKNLANTEENIIIGDVKMEKQINSKIIIREYLDSRSKLIHTKKN